MITLTEEQAQQIEETLVLICKAHPEVNGGFLVNMALDNIRAARAQEQAEHEPVACGCGATAYCLIRHTNLPEHNFTPICLSCLQEHEQNAQEVNEHEMNNFGGAYGLVTWETKPLYAAPVEPVKQEPIGRWNWNEAKFEWLTKFDYHKHHMTPLYAAPVRTKDLTDGEIWEIVDNTKPLALEFARAVIAADREKNRA